MKCKSETITSRSGTNFPRKKTRSKVIILKPPRSRLTKDYKLNQTNKKNKKSMKLPNRGVYQYFQVASKINTRIDTYNFTNVKHSQKVSNSANTS